MKELRSRGTAASTEGVEPVLAVEDLQIEAARDNGSVDTIVSGISLSLAPGETIGIVGESGSGKSMTGRAIIGLLAGGLTTRGEVRYGGRNVLELSESQRQALRGRDIGLVMQDPFTMLNPVLRCGRILEESFAQEGHKRLGRAERRAEAIRRLAEVGITDETVVDRYPFQLSGGMRQRVGIAAALARDPQILIADEPTTALDVTTQREILTLLRSIQESRGMSLVLITHDLRIAFSMCDRVYVLYAGSIVETAASPRLEAEPLHPYSHGLLLSEPLAERRVRTLVAIPGSVPKPDEVADCCPFAPRCHWAMPVCREGSPPLAEVESGRFSACVRLPAIRAEMSALRTRAETATEPTADRRLDDAIVEVRSLRKVFRTGHSTVSALDGVSLQVGANESVGLVGESGSGKTTLSRIIIGLETATEGELTIDGVRFDNRVRLRGEERRRLAGIVQIVFQDPYSSLNPMRTVGSALREAVLTHRPGTHKVRTEIEGLLESVGLPATYAERKPSALSGGERQRVAVARALAVEPRVLICDEPVSALDVSVQAQILNLLTELQRERGLAYLFITHDLSIVRQVTDFLYVMHGGRIVEAGPTSQVLDHPSNPYTVELLNSVPGIGTDWSKGEQVVTAPVTPHAIRHKSEA